VHLQEIGRAGTDLLVRHLQGETDLPPLTHIGPTLVQGDSTGPCPKRI
jgi:DNA-binding LacI/PurR family transcriptional regulator